MIKIDMEMPVDCRNCRFSSKNGFDYKCIANGENIHNSWIEQSMEEPMRPLNCPLQQICEE